MFRKETISTLNDLSKAFGYKPKPKVKPKPVIIKNKRNGKTYYEFLDTPYWRKIREKVLKRDNYQCVICKSKYNLRVHHETYEFNGFEHKHLEDLTTLCKDCHEQIHGIKK